MAVCHAKIRIFDTNEACFDKLVRYLLNGCTPDRFSVLRRNSNRERRSTYHSDIRQNSYALPKVDLLHSSSRIDSEG
jgi:hypothetical protein